MKRWYVVQTKSNQETLAVQQLRNQKFNVFFPTYIHEKKNEATGTVKKRTLPFFPSYLFVEFDVKRHARWKSINGTRGVVTLVGCTEDFLSPLPKGCVEEIMKRADERGNIRLEEAVQQIIAFTSGMQVEILGRGLKGIVATYCNHSQNRATLLLTLLNRKIKIVLPIDAIRPVTRS